MGNGDFYGEKKFCDQCNDYVAFLMSVNASYCVHCGSKVRLFSGKDREQFSEEVQRHKWQAS